ncbi:MAG: hypothetical protein CMA88_03415 [Euryarchaeota archaeon]|nr:hypothetical protein [Euryarchaeota archaeon]
MAEEEGLSETLQHPRRSLGNRHRSQAQKFLQISENDPANLSWAEQNARLSVLYDFTNEENWKILMEIKVKLGDSEGARVVLEDLFTVLGRDPSLMSQLSGLGIIDSYQKLLHAAINADPLDAEAWWLGICEDGSKLLEFSSRLKGLDVSDQRANILFSRRLERVRRGGHEEMFLELSRYLLAHRPINHEAWQELGRMYERRGEYDDAWLCYDQAQTVFPDCSARDNFRERMSGQFVGKAGVPWKAPPISDRTDFLERLGRISAVEETYIMPKADTEHNNNPFSEVLQLRKSGRFSEAFFLARRMAAEGEEGAAELVDELLGELDV